VADLGLGWSSEVRVWSSRETLRFGESGFANVCFRLPNDRFSGNGGLSLRKVSAIRRVLAFQQRENNTAAEDEWFGGRVWVLPGANVASGTNGQLAVEDTYIPNPMGFHVRDGGNNLADAVWKNHAQRKQIFEYCPELSLIMDMKLERERCPYDNYEGGLRQ
jgi:hypothetical protein